jgi:hypothetical protein
MTWAWARPSSGLVVQELVLRHRARTVLIVCPSSLQIQWQQQMRDKFGLEFRIIDSGTMKELRRNRGIHVNPWNHFPRLITSMDFIKRDRPMRLFRELLPAQGESAYPRRFDMLIVDEAHDVAPSAVGNYARDSLRTMAIRTLTPHFEHKLFLHRHAPQRLHRELLRSPGTARQQALRPRRQAQTGATPLRHGPAAQIRNEKLGRYAQIPPAGDRDA